MPAWFEVSVLVGLSAILIAFCVYVAKLQQGELSSYLGEIKEENIAPNLKTLLQQKHPYMVLDFKQFETLFAASPDMFSFWCLDNNGKCCWGGYESTSYEAAAKGKYHRLNPNHFYRRNLETYIPNKIVETSNWRRVQESMHTGFWPLIITFGGNLPAEYNSDIVQPIPSDATIIFFSSLQASRKAYSIIFDYIKEKSLNALGIRDSIKATSQQILKNSIKGSDNMLRDIAKVRKNAEKQLAVCQETIKGLTLDAEQEAGVKLELGYMVGMGKNHQMNDKQAQTLLEILPMEQVESMV